MSQSYSANDNQNYFVQDGKTTSRVLSQPGGHCSLSIGSWTPEELQRSREAAEKKKAVAEAAKSKFKETAYGASRIYESIYDLMAHSIQFTIVLHYCDRGT